MSFTGRTLSRYARRHHPLSAVVLLRVSPLTSLLFLLPLTRHHPSQRLYCGELLPRLRYAFPLPSPSPHPRLTLTAASRSSRSSHSSSRSSHSSSRSSRSSYLHTATRAPRPPLTLSPLSHSCSRHTHPPRHSACLNTRRDKTIMAYLKGYHDKCFI